MNPNFEAAGASAIPSSSFVKPRDDDLAMTTAGARPKGGGGVVQHPAILHEGAQVRTGDSLGLSGGETINALHVGHTRKDIL
jgi:hypothetical protein